MTKVFRPITTYLQQLHGFDDCLRFACARRLDNDGDQNKQEKTVESIYPLNQTYSSAYHGCHRLPLRIVQLQGWVAIQYNRDRPHIPLHPANDPLIVLERPHLLPREDQIPKLRGKSRRCLFYWFFLRIRPRY